MLGIILNLRGLKLEHKNIFEKALELYAEESMHRISFADIFNFCFMEQNGIQEIFSFDEDFDRLEGIRRKEPG